MLPKIGKNVLENLTQGMYNNSLIIYREYIQNAADQIDKAHANNAFPNEDLKIAIRIDERARRITIEDNANGIPLAEVKRRLADVADSDKVQGEEKGFRGIGRLGGLAYCRALRFVTSYAGEAQQTTMIWDADRLEKILNDRSDHSSAEEILDRIIEYRNEPCDERSHFFRVELLDIKDSNDQLLNEEKVREYISEVAPLDYGETFDTLAPKIGSFIADLKMRAQTTPPHLQIDEPSLHQYTIFVNGEQLHRQYSTYIKKNDDEIKDIHADLIRTLDGEVIAWIWYGISCFKGTLRNKGYRGLDGLRIRQFNIEIGDGHTLDQFFKDARFNGYFIGEIHTLSPELVPNARRDYFVENDALVEFEEAVKRYVNENLSKLCREGSKLNSAYRTIKTFEDSQAEYNEKHLKGFSSPKEERTLADALEKNKQRAQAAEKDLKKSIEQANKSVGSSLQKMTALIQREHGRDQTESDRQEAPAFNVDPKKKSKPKLMVDELSQLKKSERKLISTIYEVIRENLPPDQSEALIKIIHRELGGKV